MGVSETHVPLKQIPLLDNSYQLSNVNSRQLRAFHAIIACPARFLVKSLLYIGVLSGKIVLSVHLELVGRA